MLKTLYLNKTILCFYSTNNGFSNVYLRGHYDFTKFCIYSTYAFDNGVPMGKILLLSAMFMVVSTITNISFDFFISSVVNLGSVSAWNWTEAVVTGIFYNASVVIIVLLVFETVYYTLDEQPNRVL